MTTATLPRYAAATPVQTLMRVAADVYEGIMEGREIAHRYERLSRLSNVELARLGLTRKDIARAAVQGSGF